MPEMSQLTRLNQRIQDPKTEVNRGATAYVIVDPPTRLLDLLLATRDLQRF